MTERRFLAERFHIESVVTSHDPRRVNFSENTAIHESLLICRRRPPEVDARSDRPTRFVALRKMPSTPEEAIEAVEAIRTGDTGKWITVYEQPGTHIREGDWRPCQFLDPELVSAAMRLEQEKRLVSLQDRYLLGPAGQRIRDAFRPVEDHDSSYRVFWGRSKDLRTTMEAVPEQSVTNRKRHWPPATGSRPDTSSWRRSSGRIPVASSRFSATSRLWARCGFLSKTRPRVSTRRKRCAHGATARLERSDS